jgi:rhamnogalacturonan II specific xylosyltransferase
MTRTFVGIFLIGICFVYISIQSSLSISRYSYLLTATQSLVDVRYITNGNADTSLTSTSDDPSQFYILLTVNDGFFDFFTNWLHYYNKLNLPNKVIVIAEDQDAYEKLQKVQKRYPIIIENSGLDVPGRAFSYKHPMYNKIVSSRPRRLLPHLEMKRNILYTDTDIVWLKNPFDYIKGDYDIWLQVDAETHNGFTPYYCTGFFAIMSNDATIDMINKWKTALEGEPTTNQPVFNKVLHKESLSIRHLDLPRVEFPNGRDYFELFSQVYKDKVVVVHNNFVIGYEEKKERFIKEGLWHPMKI